MARQQQIEDLLLAFAKRALAFRVWATEADDQLSDPVTTETVQGVKDLEAELAAFHKQLETQQAEVQALNESAKQLRALGVQETQFSEVSVDDVNKIFARVQQLAEE